MTSQEDPQTDKKAHDAANYELDAWTKLRMKDLVKERMSGQYRDDAEGFVAAFKEITENAGFDYSRKVTLSELSDPNCGGKDPERVILDEMWEDRDKMREEIWQQLDRRAKKHLFMTKRKQTDYVEAKMSEKKVYGMQV
jgi:hypothetical protein